MCVWRKDFCKLRPVHPWSLTLFRGKGMEMSVLAAGIRGLWVIQAGAERPLSGQVSF